MFSGLSSSLAKTMSLLVGVLCFILAGSAAPANPATALLATTDSSPAASDGFHVLPPTAVLGSGNAVSLAPQEERVVPLAGRFGIPSSGVDAVAVDITLLTTTNTGVAGLSVFASGGSRAEAPAVRGTGETVPSSNTVLTKIGTDGSIVVRNNSGTSTFRMDVLGYFAAGGDGFQVLEHPVVDTQSGLGASGPLANGAVRDVQVTGADVPDDATAVFVLASVINPRGDGRVAFGPRTSTSFPVSSFEYSQGGSDTSGFFVKLDSSGGIRFKNWISSGDTHLRLHVLGYSTLQQRASGGGFAALPQTKVFDSTNNPIPAGSERDVAVAGSWGVPEFGASAVAVSVTVDQFTGGGTLKVYPTGMDPQLSPASLHFNANEDGAAGAAVTSIVRLGYGKITVKNNTGGPVAVRVAIQGYFQGYRAIPEAEEAAFIDSAVALGSSEGLAREAVWNRQLAEQLPVTVVDDFAAEDLEGTWSDDTDSSAPAGSASGLPAAPPGSATETQSGEGRTVDAAGGFSCAPGYNSQQARLGKTFKTYYGRKLFRVFFIKRWCGKYLSSDTGTIGKVVHRKGVRKLSPSDWSSGDEFFWPRWLRYDGVNDHSGHTTRWSLEMVLDLQSGFRSERVFYFNVLNGWNSYRDATQWITCPTC